MTTLTSYDAGINTFDTANVRQICPFSCFVSRVDHLNFDCDDQVYSNGRSEIILGKAIKQHNLPRDEIVVMTKVCVLSPFHLHHINSDLLIGIGVFTVGRGYAMAINAGDSDGYVNQHGLS